MMMMIIIILKKGLVKSLNNEKIIMPFEGLTTLYFLSIPLDKKKRNLNGGFFLQATLLISMPCGLIGEKRSFGCSKSSLRRTLMRLYHPFIDKRWQKAELEDHARLMSAYKPWTNVFPARESSPPGRMGARGGQKRRISLWVDIEAIWPLSQRTTPLV